MERVDTRFAMHKLTALEADAALNAMQHSPHARLRVSSAVCTCARRARLRVSSATPRARVRAAVCTCARGADRARRRCCRTTT